MERRLAAILAADVVGYSRLIAGDEEGTLSALKTLRQDVIEPLIAENRGRVVNLMGDGEQTEGQIWEAAIAADIDLNAWVQTQFGADLTRYVGVDQADEPGRKDAPYIALMSLTSGYGDEPVHAHKLLVGSGIATNVVEKSGGRVESPGLRLLRQDFWPRVCAVR